MNIVVLASIIPVSIRIYYLFSTDFPINDGGLFLAFIDGVVNTFPSIPQSIGYNGHDIPFAYPPLAFWLGAALAKLGADPVVVLHEIPIFLNIVYVVLFGILLCRIGYDRIVVALAILIFGTSRRSAEWLIMGGGLSRGFGSVFLLLTLLALLRPLDERASKMPALRLVFGGICVGLAVLSHLEWGLLASCLALLALRFSHPRTLMSYLVAASVIALTAFALVGPWVLTIYRTHGFEPFLAASRTSSWGASSVLESVQTAIAQPGYLLPFFVVGIVVELRSRKPFWLMMLICASVLTPRQGPTPIALGVAVLLAMGLSKSFEIAAKRIHHWRPALLGMAALAAVLTGLRIYRQFELASDLRPLPIEVRDAMSWVANNHAGAVFTIVNPDPWASDASAEWFPALARAVNTTTVQGLEWLPGGVFSRAMEDGQALKASASCGELAANLARFPKPEFVWAETMAECFEAPDYKRVFFNPRVSIFQRIGSP